MGNQADRNLTSKADPRTLEEAEEIIRLYSAVIDNFPGGIILTDKNLNVLLCNSELKRLMEFPPNLFLNHVPTLPEIFRFNAIRGEYGPGNPDDLVMAKMSLVEMRIPHVFERTRPDGRVLEIRGTPLPEGGFVTSYNDVTEQRSYQKHMLERASKDALTGLANRASLREQFDKFVARAKRGEDFALFYIDLDGFKPINDKHGHRVGDAMLVEIGNRISACIRGTDFASRIGGDEFVILQSNVKTLHDIIRLADRILASICEPFDFEGLQLFTGASIGVCSSLFESEEIDFEAMMSNCDMAMYKCKGSSSTKYKIHRGSENFGNRNSEPVSAQPNEDSIVAANVTQTLQ